MPADTAQQDWAWLVEDDDDDPLPGQMGGFLDDEGEGEAGEHEGFLLLAAAIYPFLFDLHLQGPGRVRTYLRNNSLVGIAASPARALLDEEDCMAYLSMFAISPSMFAEVLEDTPFAADYIRLYSAIVGHKLEAPLQGGGRPPIFTPADALALTLMWFVNPGRAKVFQVWGKEVFFCLCLPVIQCRRLLSDDFWSWAYCCQSRATGIKVGLNACLRVHAPAALTGRY